MIGVLSRIFMFIILHLSISKNILLIREAKVSKSKLMHSLSQSKIIFSFEQNAIVSCYSKSIAFLLEHSVYENPDGGLKTT